jgi:hypothetical protein
MCSATWSSSGATCRTPAEAATTAETGSAATPGAGAENAGGAGDTTRDPGDPAGDGAGGYGLVGVGQDDFLTGGQPYRANSPGDRADDRRLAELLLSHSD